MSSFERRGLPFRDVFDSSFDEVQRVDYLTLDESREVLQSRVTGLPAPYQCLCHCLAGGLPRELIRVARELVHWANELKTDSPLLLTGALVGSELRGKVAAAMVAARSAPSAQQEWVLAWIQRQEVDQADSELLRGSYAEFVQWPGRDPASGETEADQRLREIVVELTVFSYYASTVLDFYTDEEQLVPFLVGDTSPQRLSDDAKRAIAILARARQQFSLTPGLAATDVTTFRKSTWLVPWTL